MSLKVEEKPGPGAALFPAQETTEVCVQMLGHQLARLFDGAATVIIILKLHQLGNAEGQGRGLCFVDHGLLMA